MSQQIKASIIGATGYAGLELIRLLQAHPEAKIQHLLSNSESYKFVSDVYPHLKDIITTKFESLDVAQVANNSDVVFLALPHMASQKIVPDLIGKTKIIDLSADFRLTDLDHFETYYKQKHTCEHLIKDFIYGFTEKNKDQIRSANNIANPGCFALAMQLGLLPLKEELSSVKIHAITGSSGSGKSASAGTHHPIRSHNVKSYSIGKHRHLAEVMQTIELKPEHIDFVPTSGPFVRGIHVTLFCDTKNDIEESKILDMYDEKYKNEPFVRIKKDNVEVADIVGSNYCDISVQKNNNTVIVQSTIDNLVKGAAGNAVQCMNLMVGLDEEVGLNTFSPVYP
jgi:N-acetyl-gamma-glutamyl-phosphate reductase